jgi:CRP-like cAMP-binding protein
VLVRLRAVHLVEDHVLQLPVTPVDLTDALGLSSVHVNRVLQELRGSGLIPLRGGAVHVLNWEGLKAAGDFNPTSLHLARNETL